MSTPVILLMTSGTLVMIDKISSVILDAPISPLASATMVTLFTLVNGEATSAAILGSVCNIMSTTAAFPYSFQASAFLAICSASALALASIANASASPFNVIASASASASRTALSLSASAIFSNLNF